MKILILRLGEDRASFYHNYIERIKAENDTVSVVLKGIIIRTKGNRQIFYLMRGYRSSHSDISTTTDLEKMINSFVVAIPLSDSLFPKKQGYGYIILFVVIVLMGFFYYRNKRVQSSKNPMGGDSKYFWRCRNCQRANHVDNKSCQRCGSERFVDQNGTIINPAQIQ